MLLSNPTFKMLHQGRFFKTWKWKRVPSVCHGRTIALAYTEAESGGFSPSSRVTKGLGEGDRRRSFNTVIDLCKSLTARKEIYSDYMKKSTSSKTVGTIKHLTKPVTRFWFFKYWSRLPQLRIELVLKYSVTLSNCSSGWRNSPRSRIITHDFHLIDVAKGLW